MSPLFFLSLRSVVTPAFYDIEDVPTFCLPIRLIRFKSHFYSDLNFVALSLSVPVPDSGRILKYTAVTLFQLEITISVQSIPSYLILLALCK